MTFFGGKRVDANNGNNNLDPIGCVISKFQEQSGRKLDKETLAQIQTLLISDDDRHVFWKREWKTTLFYYQMSWDYNLVDDYPVNKRWNDEMKSLKRIDFQIIFDHIFTGSSEHANYRLSPLVMGMLLHDENYQFLCSLHRQHGGDGNALFPKNGGSLRNTLTSFDVIPNVMRLDLIHPLTHHLVCSRWMEMSIDDMEDFHLMHSLIASIYPEVGTNFLMYYTKNKCYRSSTLQYPIDTNPSLSSLQRTIASITSNASNGESNASNPFMTAINIVPTFIVSDNFSNISLAYSRRDISSKTIHPINDEEHKSQSIALALNQNSEEKQLQFASNWFPEGDDNAFDGNDGEGYGPWKWQFMNDNHQFEDFEDSSSRIIEKWFAKRLTFGTFHVSKRSKVQYQVNFKTMIQKNLTSNRIRSIRRVPLSVKGAAPSINSHYKPRPKLTVDYMKWQFCDKFGIWTDYPVANSKQLNDLKSRCDKRMNWNDAPYRRCNTMTIRMKSNENGKWYICDIDVYHQKQRNQSTQKQRDIRQIAVYSDGTTSLDSNGQKKNRRKRNGGNVNSKNIRNRWEWMDDDGTFKRYDDETSAQIETAR